MITIREQSSIASLSELRTKSEEILKQLSRNKVILQKHNKPVAVMLSYAQYALLEELLDRLEDYTLGMTALERDKKASKKDFIDIEKW